MNAHRALTGTLWAKEGSRFSRSSISILASRSQARSLLLSASCSEDASASTGSGWSFRHLLTQLPTASRNQPVGPRHLRDSPVLLHDLKDHLLLELTAESLYRHNQIPPPSLKNSTLSITVGETPSTPRNRVRPLRSPCGVPGKTGWHPLTASALPARRRMPDAARYRRSEPIATRKRTDLEPEYD